MHNVELLISSLEYIENHLKDDIKTEDVAKACFCSKSALEKLFRCVNHISVHDYMVRRRMMMAARRIAENPEEAILIIALEYGYSSHEAFARAFKQVWNCKPSEFRCTKFLELFPRFEVCLEDGDESMMEKKHVDISQLYDLFLERKECYFVCCDIRSLMPINNISRKAGDLAILETMNRMNDAAGADDIVFRIGGDEFCILTASKDPEYAKEIANKIKKQNGETFVYEGRQIPLGIHIAVKLFDNHAIKYSELFTGLHKALMECKE